MTTLDTVRIGFLIFPGMLQLDFTGAYGVLAAAGKRAEICLVWKNTDQVLSSDGLSFAPSVSFPDCPALDVIIVPGGGGIVPLLDDESVLAFLKKNALTAGFICSICTGALVLGAAGLLQGYKATTHWLSHDMLALLGAEPVRERVVADRDRITAAGVTSGIDMALTLAGRLWGDETAMAIQLNMEYAPVPPYASGSPERAPRELVAAMRAKTAARQAERLDAVKKAAAKLIH